jgi:seryl-tRNA synthetase
LLTTMPRYASSHDTTPSSVCVQRLQRQLRRRRPGGMFDLDAQQIAHVRRSMSDIAALTTDLKNNMEAADKLRTRRKELRSSINKEGLPEKEEALLAKELETVCKAIEKLENERRRLLEAIAVPSAESPK